MKKFMLALPIFSMMVLSLPSYATPSTPLTVSQLASWKEVNLAKKVPDINLKLKLPPTAKISKNPNGNAEVDLGNHSILTISAIAVANLDEAMTTADDYYLHNEGYHNAKKIVSDNNGFVYTRQLKTEDNGNQYAPETHFVYYLTGKDGSVYEISEDVDIDYIGKAQIGEFSAQRATTLYEFIKQNAQVVE